MLATDCFVWAGFFGAWLLVAGPMFQAALELRAENIDRAEMHRVKAAVLPPERISPWWWLVPPVLYVLHWRRSVRYRGAMFAAMTVEQREKMVAYINKATGWMMVAGGGTLLALKETWDLVKRYGLPPWSFWMVAVGMLLASAINTAVRMNQADRIIHPPSPGT